MNEDDILEAAQTMLKIKYSSVCYNEVTDGEGKVEFYTPTKNIPKDVVKLSILVKVSFVLKTLRTVDKEESFVSLFSNGIK